MAVLSESVDEEYLCQIVKLHPQEILQADLVFGGDIPHPADRYNNRNPALAKNLNFGRGREEKIGRGWCGWTLGSRVQPPILAIAHIAKFGDQMSTIIFTFWHMNIHQPDLNSDSFSGSSNLESRKWKFRHFGAEI